MATYFLDTKKNVLLGHLGRPLAEDPDAAAACADRLEAMHAEIAAMEKQVGSFFDRGGEGERDRGKLESLLDGIKWALYSAALTLSIHYDHELPLAAAAEAAEAAEDEAKAALEGGAE